MSGTINDPIAQLLAAFGIAPASISNSNTLSGISGIPLAGMAGALGGPPPSEPVIPAAPAPAIAPAVTDPTVTSALPVAPVADLPQSPLEAAVPSAPAGPVAGGGGDIHSIISDLVSGFGLPSNAPASVTGSPIAQAISGIGHGGLGGGLK